MYLKINTNEQLLVLIDEILNNQIKWIALDTEFERKVSYFPTLSLMQLATPNQTWVIDSLAEIDLKPLHKILENPQILKVLHAGDQDFDAINYKLGFKITPFIDTQVMATFASMGKALSLEKLAMHFLNIQIDKTLQNSRWLHRPLSEAQIAYAACDGEYIAKIYPLLNEQLIELNRLEWVIHEMQALFNKYANPNPVKEWLKFCQPKDNYVTSLHAYVLVNWREKIAKANNIARPLIMPNHLIEHMIKTKNHRLYSEKFCNIKYLEDFLSNWNSIKELLENIEMQHFIETAVTEHFAKTPPGHEALLEEINKYLQTAVHELNLPADVILSKQQKLNAIKTNGESLAGWRKQIFQSLFAQSTDS